MTFTRGDTKGAGIGFTYDSQRDTMWLLDQAEVHVAGSAAAGAMDVTAGAFGEARRDRYMRLRTRREAGASAARPSRPTRRWSTCCPDRDDPDRIELRGNARITGGEGMGALRAMQARDINLDYAEDGRTVRACHAGRPEQRHPGRHGARRRRTAAGRGIHRHRAWGPTGP